MKKVFIGFVTCLLLASTINVKGQQSTYSKVLYDSLQQGIMVSCMTGALDHGFVLAGSNPVTSVMKLDTIGNLQSVRGYFDPLNNYLMVSINSSVSTLDSTYVLAGSVYNMTTHLFEALCMKLNPNGDTVWAKSISLNSHNFNIFNVQQTLDSGYFLTGTDGNYTGIFVVKLNPQGNLEWANTLSGTAQFYVGFSGRQTPDGDFLIIGDIENINPWQSDVCIVKISPTGSVLWANKYKLPTSTYGTGFDVVITHDGYLCYMNLDDHVVLMKTDYSGNVLESIVYNEPNSGSLVGMARPKLRATKDSSYVFISGGSWVSRLSKTDSNGNVLWTKQITMDVADVLETEDKGFMVAGNGPLLGVKKDMISPQIGLVKTDSTGYNPDCEFNVTVDSISDHVISTPIVLNSSYGGVANPIHLDYSFLLINSRTGCVDVTGGVDQVNNDQGVSVYPNPSTGLITISSMQQTHYQLSVYNVFGSEIYHNVLREHQSEIDLRTQPNGIYFLRFTGVGKNVETLKLLINR